DAVETGHGEVARHVDAELVEPSEDAEGHQVVEGHHGGRTGGEHLFGDAVPVGHGGAAADRVHGQRGIGVRERVQGAEARTVGSAADGPCHVQQVVVAEPAQVLDQLGHAAGVVDAHGREVGGGRAAVEHHHRGDLLDQLLELD